MGIIIAIVIYEIVSIGGVCLYLHWRKAKEAAPGEGGDSFVTSNRDMSWPVVGASLALSLLGVVKIFGIMEMTWNLGTVVMWFSIATVFPLCVVCLATGRWARRMKVSTVPEIIARLFGRRIALICTSVIAIQTFAILTMETQGLGIIFNTLTRNQISIPAGAVIGGIVGIAYVIVAGMKEVGWVNMINAVIMYVALVVAMVYLTNSLPGGWQEVGQHFVSSERAHMITFFGAPGVFFSFALNSILALTFAQSISQMGLQSAMAAKDEKTIIKALWVAAPVNGFFGLLTVAIGIAAKALVERGEMIVPDPSMAAKTAGSEVIVNYLPDWIVALLLAAFLGAILSTFAITTMGLGALFAKNIYTLKKPNASERELTFVTRVMIVITGVAAMAVSSFLPTIVNGANWSFAWLCPVFWNVIYGLFWKRSRVAAGIVFAVSWILILLWTYTPAPFWMGLDGIPIPYITLAVSLVLGVALNLALPGEPGYFRQEGSREARAEYAADMEGAS